MDKIHRDLKGKVRVNCYVGAPLAAYGEIF